MRSGSEHRPRSDRLARCSVVLSARARSELAAPLASRALERRPRRELAELPPPASSSAPPPLQSGSARGGLR